MNTSWRQKLVFLFIVMLGSVSLSLANPISQGVWDRIDKSQLPQAGIDRPVMPSSYEAFRLNKAALQNLLSQAPEEFTDGRTVILTLPMPDG